MEHVNIEFGPEGKFIKAVKWAFVQNWGRYGIATLVTFILACILSPSDFGIVAMASVYIAFIQMFLGLGFNTAIIQRKELKPLHLDSIFWLIVVSSLLLTVASIILSSWWARVNRLPNLALVICVLSLAIPIQGLTIVQQALFHREMDFKSLALRDNLSAFASGIIGVGLAFAGFGVWALVGQQLCMAVVALVLLWTLSHWRPSLQFSPHHVKELVVFSLTVFVGRLGVYLQRHADALIIGIFFGPTALGLYRLADRVMNLPLQLVTKAIHVVSLPQFSMSQENRRELKQSLLSCWRASSIMTIPAMMCLGALSDPLMAALGPRWALAANVLKILCVIGAVKSLTLYTGTMLQALSKPRIQAFLVWCLALANTVALIIVAILLQDAPVSQQIVAIATSRACVFVLGFLPTRMMIAVHFASVRARDIVATVAPGVLAGTVMILAVIGLGTSFHFIGHNPLLTLGLSGSVAVLLGFGTILLLDHQLRKSAFDICLNIMYWCAQRTRVK